MLDTGTSKVDDEVTQIRDFQFVVEAVTFGRRPSTSDVVQVNHRMMVPVIRFQLAEGFCDGRLSNADCPIEKYAVDHLSRLSHRRVC